MIAITISARLLAFSASFEKKEKKKSLFKSCKLKFYLNNVRYRHSFTIIINIYLLITIFIYISYNSFYIMF